MTEILAPAGDEKSAYAAINSGADAIYLGLTAFSARSSAQNFDMPALENLIKYAHVLGVKIYVAMNTLVKDAELQQFVEAAVAVHNAGADAIIIQDLYLGAYLKNTYPQMTLHLSTPAGICNEYGARYAKELGFDRVILARETAFEDIVKIAEIIETEVFVQGALCTCFSGQCYLSSFGGGNSGNRGKCKQPCRKKYKIDRKDYENYAYRLSLSDLKVGEDIQKLVKAGVASFKIEGRMRRPEYVSAAVGYYKNLLKGVASRDDESALKRTYNRGNYTKGLMFGQEKSLISSAVQGHIGEFVGTVKVQNGKYLIATTERFSEGDGFKILRDGKELCGATAEKYANGALILKSTTPLKNGDKAFVTTDNALNAKLLDKSRKHKVIISAELSVGNKPRVLVNNNEFIADFTAERAKGKPITAEDIKNCFSKVDKLPFEVEFGAIELQDVFVPMSLLNAFRREVFARYAEIGAPSRQSIEKVLPLPKANPVERNGKTCVVSRDLNGITADIGVLKPDDYFSDLTPLIDGFKGEAFIYLPTYLTGAEIEGIKPKLNAFVGIYCGGNYAVMLARELRKKLFCGAGFNISNYISAENCPAEYFAISKELTVAEAKPLSRANSFILSDGDIKVMDLIYCPFSKSCKDCDKRNFYTLTDEDGRQFPLRRYKTSTCRFELFNCANLKAENYFTGKITELCVPDGAYKNHTGGHFKIPVL
ncbi:MAG: U32 family peptidase [Clostridia bacterium]|nr:U32 family peptidase [Clostridia bacterium]